MGSFSIDRVRSDFPILQQKIGRHRLVYFDNAATTQKPEVVIEALNSYYRYENANVHRGIHYLSEQATLAYENARKVVKEYINAPQEKEIIFVRGVTEGINLLANGFGSILKPKDEILITALEHHANIVPWQMIALKTGAKLKVIPIDKGGEIVWQDIENSFSENTKLLSCVHISNAIGTVVAVERLCKIAKKFRVPVIVDGAQSAAHLPIDVQNIGCDFYLFSAHKVLGPTGIGVLWGKEDWLEKLPPYQGGGDMIERVSFERTTYKDIPAKFEAGTPHIAGGIGLSEALIYINGLDTEGIMKHEAGLLEYATKQLMEIPDLKIWGEALEKSCILNFSVKGIHSYDISTFLDSQGIAVRTGLHCAEPLMDFLGSGATTRASLAFYNTFEEIDCLKDALIKAVSLFK